MTKRRPAAPLFARSHGWSNSTAVPPTMEGSVEPEHVSFLVLVSDGTLDLRFGPATTQPTIFAVNGLSIRPADLLSMGIDCGGGSLEADGVTIDSFTLFEGPVNSLVTVTTSLGTLVNADADDELQGIQIATNALGQATIMVRRPTGAGTALVSIEAVTGEKTGCSAIDYELPTGRNFDFNHINTTSAIGQSPTQTPVADPLHDQLATLIAVGASLGPSGWLASCTRVWFDAPRRNHDAERL